MNVISDYLKSALDAHPELKYQIYQQDWQTDFLRFYQSQSNYNITKDKKNLSVRLYKGKKSYALELDNPDRKSVDTALEEALAIIDKLPEDPDFVDLEDDKTLAEKRPQIDNIKALGLRLKTELLSSLDKSVSEYGFELYGTFICNYAAYRIINSNGLDKESQNSPIYLEIKAVHRQSQITVLETFGGEDFALFDLEAFRRRLIAKILHTQNPVADAEPGHYEVILAPRCVAEFVQYLAWGMSAAALDRHSSFFEGKQNQQVFSPLISIADDPTDPEMIRADYSFDGHIYRPLSLVEKGVFKNFMCDQYYHYKTGLPKNGNSGVCLKIAPGENSLDEMIKGVKRGLYISSLHYMNFINMKETSLTGLTRDGTFLIENGKITRVLSNLRFTEKISSILEKVTELEDKAYSIPFSDNYADFDISTVKAPHAKVSSFYISSSTKTI